MDVSIFGLPLVCPLCKGVIIKGKQLIICNDCQMEYIQPLGNYIYLLPNLEFMDPYEDWKNRQQEMEQWYQDLLLDLESTLSVFENDYFPFQSYFSSLKGNILDLGGGVGIVRHFLSDDAKLIVVDPSLDWLKADWHKLSKTFPCLERPPEFVCGIGEYLMFRNNSLDVVLSLWSMNHVSQPAKVVQEILRVLKPGGKFLIVLEDMEANWRDILSRSLNKKIGWLAWISLLKMKFHSSILLDKWPVQSDHLFITQRDIKQWKRYGFRQLRREWIANYLTYEFEKI